MKQLVLAFLLVACTQLTISAQSKAADKGFKTNVESPDFTINDLYSQDQLVRLQNDHPEKLLEIKSFFQTWDDLSPTAKSQLNKRKMYRLYIRDREAFDVKLTQLAD